MKFIHGLPAVTVILVIATGCASMSDLNNQVQAKPSCCASFRDLPYEDATEATPLRFATTNNSQVFSFRGGKSHFLAVRIPPLPSESARLLADVDVSLSMPAFGLEAYNNTVRAFCPAYTLLDDNYSEIASSAVQVQFVPQSWFRGPHWTGSFGIPKQARYLLIHTTAQLLESSINEGPSGGYIGPYSSLGPGVVSSRHSEGNASNEYCAPDANLSITIHTGSR